MSPLSSPVQLLSSAMRPLRLFALISDLCPLLPLDDQSVQHLDLNKDIYLFKDVGAADKAAIHLVRLRLSSGR